MSHHDLEVEFKGQPRIAISDAPFNWELTCTRARGWQLWVYESAPITDKVIRSYVIAGEHESNKLNIWNKDILILDAYQVK